MVQRGEEEEGVNNLLSWQIVSVSEKLIEIDLVFARPLHVSQGEIADKLLV